ncbi:hypothetical protein MBAV_003770 [Candidatus Magnetobacterium bavaricum]|uniref:Cyclophilin TM1367-like domain-containing protein n=1 Tax=Candidatus Magnetobacterium bavaricum TaxID=29290 RepID=A0A0F3GQ29_9BACT|nr:hypothetical protein MBAV_003770 [Candidatus Magnetobacterium bavaricum]
MSDRILLSTGEVKLRAELNDSATAATFRALLPMEVRLSRWGEEYYGDCGINVDIAEDAKEVMEVGELAVWPVGNALCIFFGPTPVSTGDEPRAASKVNPIGKLTDSHEPLKKLASSISVKISVL